MAKISLGLMSWELDSETGVITATFHDVASDGDPDPVAYVPVETHVIQFTPTKRDVYKYPRNERAANARIDNTPPSA